MLGDLAAGSLEGTQSGQCLSEDVTRPALPIAMSRHREGESHSVPESESFDEVVVHELIEKFPPSERATALARQAMEATAPLSGPPSPILPLDLPDENELNCLGFDDEEEVF
jgi:hypothetical protein